MANVTDVRLCGFAEEDDEPHRQFYEDAKFVTSLYILPVICLPGLVGNILTLIVLSKGIVKQSTQTFLTALAVSDTIKLLNEIIYSFMVLLNELSPKVGNHGYYYFKPYATYVFKATTAITAWITVCVAVERYLLVCHPVRCRNFTTRKRAVTASSMVYVVMVLVTLPFAFRYRTVECLDTQDDTKSIDVEFTELWQNFNFVTPYIWFLNTVKFLIPLIILVILNTKIIIDMRKRRAAALNSHNETCRKVTPMLVAVIVVFIVCIMPEVILMLVFVGWHAHMYYIEGIREVTDTFVTLNSSVNFMIYCMFSKKFRDSFTLLFYKEEGDHVIDGMGFQRRDNKRCDFNRN